MALSWAFKKQLSVFSLFAMVILAVVGTFIYIAWPEPTCFDSRKNQGEDGVDCGGPNCIPCSNQIRDINILWTRALKISDSTYDFAALIENSNQFLEAKRFQYFIKLYDAGNILIAIKENSTFIYPGEKFVIFEPNISTQSRPPARAILEIASVSWDKAESKPIKIDILRNIKFLENIGEAGPPRVEIEIKNQSNSLYRSIEAVAVLYGSSGDVQGVSKTVIDKMDIDETKTLTFTWPNQIPGVQNVQVFFRQLPQ